MKPYVYPYKTGSNSATLLAKGLDTLKVRPDGKYINRPNHLVINWGMSQVPKWVRNHTKVLNHWNKLAISSNKLTSLQRFKEHGVSCPEFTTDIKVAKKWIQEGNVVMCRTILRGHSGHGCVVAQKEAELVKAPLYTKYVKRKREFRITIFGGKIIDILEKRKKADFDGEVNTFIRCNHNGYVFCYENVKAPECVKAEALKAVEALGLDFGSADLAYNEHYDKAYVFEVNSSAGFSSNESPLFKRYLEAFKEYLKTH